MDRDILNLKNLVDIYTKCRKNYFINDFVESDCDSCPLNKIVLETETVEYSVCDLLDCI